MELFKLLGKVVIEGIEEANKKLGEVSKTAENIGSKLEKAGDKISGVGTKLLPVTTALGGVAVASGKMAIDFEDAMAKVSTIADTSQISLDKLQTAIIELSNQTGISSSEIADNVYNAISAGQETGDAVNFVSNATKLATAGFTDSASALDVLTTTLNAYGMETKEVTKVSDMLIQTQNMGKTTVGELAGYLGKVIPTAKNAGVGLEQVTTAYAKLTANGIQTADSTTYLNSMLNELNKSGTNVSKILKEQTGKSFNELMGEGKSLADVLAIVDEGAKKSGKSFSDVWSSAEAGKAGSVIYDTTNKLGDFNKAVEQMNQASKNNATEEAFQKMKTTSFSVQKTLNELKNTCIELGNTIMEMLAPYITMLSEKVHKLCVWFGSLSDRQKEMIVKIGAIVAALGPALILIGKLISGIGGAIKAFGLIQGVLSKGATSILNVVEAFKLAKAGMTAFASQTSALGTALAGISAPVLAVAAAIGVLIAAFIYLWNTNEDFRNSIIEIWNEIKATFDEFTQGIVDELNSLGFDFEDFGALVREIWDGLCSFLAPIFEGAFKYISNTVQKYTNTILGIIKIFTGLLEGDWSKVFEGIKQITKAQLDYIKNFFTNILSVINNLTGGELSKLAEKFSNLKLKLPDIKLPHFKINGSFSLNPPKVPSFGVDWYAKAMNNPMIMNQPTAFGINANGQIMAGGESGSEVVSGTETLMNMISTAVSAQNERIVECCENMLSMMAQYMPEMANMNLVMDTGVVVGELAPSIDAALGKLAIRNGRGV